MSRRLIALTIMTFVIASCGISDGPSLLGITTIDQPSLTPEEPTPTPDPDSDPDPDPGSNPTPTPTPTPTPEPSPSPTPAACSNAPANAHYTIPGEEGPNCAWACDANYFYNGVDACINGAGAIELNCANGEVAVGIYGRTGMWFDQLGVRCATLVGGVITGSPTNGAARGNPNTGNAFSFDCPAGHVLERVKGGNKPTGQAWCSATSSSYHNYGCVELSSGTQMSLSSKYGESSPGQCAAAQQFDLSCQTGQYVYGITVSASGDPNYVGYTLGINCR